MLHSNMQHNYDNNVLNGKHTIGPAQVAKKPESENRKMFRLIGARMNSVASNKNQFLTEFSASKIIPTDRNATHKSIKSLISIFKVNEGVAETQRRLLHVHE